MSISPIDELHDRVEKSAKTRFNADRRLLKHAKLSVWTTAFTSIALIAISVWDALGLTHLQPKLLISALQIISSVFILVYSVILSTKDYGVKAKEMHLCGLALSDLRLRLYPLLGTAVSLIDYAKYSLEYSEIMAKFPNHEDVDYQRMKITHSYYKIDRTIFGHWSDRVMFYYHYCVEFLHYYVVIAIEIGLAYWVITARA
ncbi:hypothetical protein GALL_276110 [mine drainage metagenome]|uniref:SMODS and SLOG-associating 2TM effector domain-containing protein n=1 Tax=mine drainage metagenome TaxID=410659 RepID=A0A1J5R3C0_9ZZZZ